MDYGKYIEYTNLKSPSSKEIKAFVETANAKGYAGVCLQAGDLGVAAKYRRPDLKLVTVAGFPPIHAFQAYAKQGYDQRLNLGLGLYSPREIDTIKGIIDSGVADELDLVFPIYWYATGKLGRIYHFLKGIKQRYNRPVKVICELGTIFRNRINLYEIYCLLADSGVDYFKTNTGLIKQDFRDLAVALQHLQLLVSDMDLPKLKLKVSGGVRTEEQVRFLIKLGVDRIGTSSIAPAKVVKVGDSHEQHKTNS